MQVNNDPNRKGGKRGYGGASIDCFIDIQHMLCVNVRIYDLTRLVNALFLIPLQSLVNISPTILLC